jgi:DNA-binding transcriptional MerR regulator
MQIRDLAHQTEVPAKTIRYYEFVGLLPPPARKPNGYRSYSQTDVQRLKLVAGARRLGISMAEIQEILDMRDRQEAPCSRLLEQVAEKRAEIQRRVDQLKQMDTELAKLHELGMTVADLRSAMFPYLTNSEAIKLALLAFEKDVAMLSCCAG